MSPSGPPAPLLSAPPKPLLDLRPGTRTAVVVAALSVALLAIVYVAIWIIATVTHRGLSESIQKAADDITSATSWTVLPAVAILIGIWAAERSNKALSGLEPWTSMSTAAYCVLTIAATITGAVLSPDTATNVTTNLLIPLGTFALACKLIHSWSSTKDQRKISATTVRDESSRARAQLNARIVAPAGALRRFTLGAACLSAALGVAGAATWLLTHQLPIKENVPFFLTTSMLIFVDSFAVLLGSYVSAANFFASTASTSQQVRRWLWVTYYSLPTVVVVVILASTPSVRALALPFAAAWLVAVLAAHIPAPGGINAQAWRWLPGQALVDAVYRRASLRFQGATRELQNLGP